MFLEKKNPHSCGGGQLDIIFLVLLPLAAERRSLKETLLEPHLKQGECRLGWGGVFVLEDPACSSMTINQ